MARREQDAIHLQIGTIVRHRFDGARGVVCAIDQDVGMYVVRFKDRDDWVPFADVRRAGPRACRPAEDRP